MGLINLLKKKCKTKLFTTPSHGQKFFIVHKFMQFYKADISETETHNPQNALIEAEKNAAEIYGSKYTKFLTNGSTSGIIAAVLSCVKTGEKVLVWKNAHPCHFNAIKLAGGIPVYYDLPYLKDWGIYGAIDKDNLSKIFKTEKITALIVTSPSYEGVVSNIKEIYELCKLNKVKLIVDEAHGALYPFSEDLPPTSIGIADFTVQSLHKTAGGLNPTALLHSKEIDTTDALKMINTTSPSYPLLMTIEANIKYLASKKGKLKIKNLVNQLKIMRKTCSGIEFFGDDITKILIKKCGLSGEELSSELFHKFGIEDEKTNSVSTMLLCGLGTDEKKLKHLTFALKKIGRR